MENLNVVQLKIEQIKPDPNQPRKTINDLNLIGLSKSIKTHGVLQPITVRLLNNEYVIVMGERRYRASQLVKLKTIPCVVREFNENDILEIQIIENLQRKDVDPIEEAEAITILKDRYNPEEIAIRIGRSTPFVYQRIKLSELIDGFRPYVKSNDIQLK